jgi:tRNA nucleotidyltransferase (CCA-adding enzyme)
MTKEERISRMLEEQSALFFLQTLLHNHPETNLYLVGGAVRDTLLGRHQKAMDFDFVVTGLQPVDIQRWLRQHGEVNLVGQKFGVYKFMPRGFSPETVNFIDIALPRKEQQVVGSLGGSKDFNIQSDPNLAIEEDLARRDFTINAMAFHVREGRLVDPFHGQEDLRKRTLRAVGEPTQRFNEDLSRILRGIRFAAELDFTIEEATSRAMKALLPKLNNQKEVEGTLDYVVPRETVGMELAKALSGNPKRAIEELVRHGGLNELFPEIQQLQQTHASYLQPVQHTQPNELIIVLALLLRKLDKARVRRVLSCTGLDTLERGSAQRTEADVILSLVSLWQRQLSAEQVRAMRPSEFERLFLDGKSALFLRYLDLLEETSLVNAIRTRQKEIQGRWLVDHDESIAPLLSGQDVLGQGVLAGPEIRQWLDLVRDLQLDGTLMRREDALTWLKKELKQKTTS